MTQNESKMRAKEFILLEYKRDKTAAAFGTKMLTALTNDQRSVAAPLGTARAALKNQVAEPLSQGTQLIIINDILTVLEKADPTPNKEFTQWLARCYANGEEFLEDLLSNGKDMLEDYIEMKKFRVLPERERNIMNLKFNDLYTVTHNADLINALDNAREASTPVDKGQSTVLLDNSEVRIIIPEDKAAACYYGQGTKWCTAARNNNMFDHYNRDGKMYILLPKTPQYDGEKYQIHFASEQFMDDEDNQVSDILQLLQERFGDLIPVFDRVEDNLWEYVLFAPDDEILKAVDALAELGQEYIWESIYKWEQNDTYFAEWKEDEARKKGYVLMPDGTPFTGSPKQKDELEDEGYNVDDVDDDLEVDYDRMHEDYEISNYLNYNDEARRFETHGNEATRPSAATVRNTTQEMYDNDGKLRKLGSIEEIIAHGITDKLGDKDGGLARYYNDRLYLEWGSDGNPVAKVTKNG